MAQNIEALLAQHQVVEPPERVRQEAKLKGYASSDRASIEDADASWAEAADSFEWSRPRHTVQEFDGTHHRWFVGATSNITLNALDRHVREGRANKVALLWIGEDGSERAVTYRMLLHPLHLRHDRHAQRRGARPRRLHGRDRLPPAPLLRSGRRRRLFLHERHRLGGTAHHGGRRGTPQPGSVPLGAGDARSARPQAPLPHMLRTIYGAPERYDAALADTLTLHVREELGPIATPAEVTFVDSLPKTRSGKIMRRLLKARELGQDPGDTSALES